MQVDDSARRAIPGPLRSCVPKSKLCCASGPACRTYHKIPSAPGAARTYPSESEQACCRSAARRPRPTSHRSMRERGEYVSFVCARYLSTNFVENNWHRNFPVILSNIDWFIVCYEIITNNCLVFKLTVKEIRTVLFFYLDRVLRSRWAGGWGRVWLFRPTLRNP